MHIRDQIIVMGFIVPLLFSLSVDSTYNSENVFATRTYDLNHDNIILLTGFEPFADYETNPSELIAEELNNTLIENMTIIGIVLPVDFEKSVERIIEKIIELNPILVISLGLSPAADTMEVETVAVNLQYDPYGDHPLFSLRPITPHAPLFRFSTLNIKKTIYQLKQVNIPVSLSLSAGWYICNTVFYKTMEYLKENNKSIPAGFIHVPPLQSEHQQGMKLETMIQATLIIIQSNLT